MSLIRVSRTPQDEIAQGTAYCYYVPVDHVLIPLSVSNTCIIHWQKCQFFVGEPLVDWSVILRTATNFVTIYTLVSSWILHRFQLLNHGVCVVMAQSHSEVSQSVLSAQCSGANVLSCVCGMPLS